MISCRELCAKQLGLLLNTNMLRHSVRYPLVRSVIHVSACVRCCVCSESTPILYVRSIARGLTFVCRKTVFCLLQRDIPAIVWGFAPEGTTVKTLFAGQTYTSTADATSTWRQTLPVTPATTTPQTINFTASTGDVAALTDVLFGDVYVGALYRS
jgi:hypothetical protein